MVAQMTTTSGATAATAAMTTAATTAANAPKPKPKEWQGWTTVGANSSTAVLFQDSSLWLDLSNVVSVRITAHIGYVTGSSAITLQTSNSPDGPWTDVNSTGLDSEGKAVLVVSSLSENETYKARRYLRWSVGAGGADWEMCFRLTYEVL